MKKSISLIGSVLIASVTFFTACSKEDLLPTAEPRIKYREAITSQIKTLWPLDTAIKTSTTQNRSTQIIWPDTVTTKSIPHR